MEEVGIVLEPLHITSRPSNFYAFGSWATTRRGFVLRV